MKEWKVGVDNWFNEYCSSFNEVADEQRKNLNIKRDHSFRVAAISVKLAEKLQFSTEELKLAYFIGLFHDIGRFRQLVEFGTFNDLKSIDHADCSVQVIVAEKLCNRFDIEKEKVVFAAVQNHNKRKLPENFTEEESRFACLIRDADKMDILKVLSEYYTHQNIKPNHTLTWELPKGKVVSENVKKEILAGKLVSKQNVVSEIDVKIMQMSWVYDIKFSASFEHLEKNKYLETIYNTLPKNDLVNDIYKKVKTFAENKTLVQCRKL